MEFLTCYKKDFEYMLSQFNMKEFEGSSWFITGASGFIMTYLVRFLLYANEYVFREKCRLYLLCRNREKLFAKLGIVEEVDGLEIIEQDVNDSLCIDVEVDYVIHGASIAATRLFASNPVEVIAGNTVGLYNLLNALRQKKPKSILFLSSGSVYGEIPVAIRDIAEQDYFPLDFTDIKNCYAQSKRMGELLMASYHAEYGLPCRNIRISHTYGPGIDLYDGHVYSDFVRSLLNHEDILIYNDGTAVRPFCYVADAVLAFLLILTRGMDGESYNMANPYEMYSVYELAVILAQKLAKDQIAVKRLQETRNIPRKQSVNISKLRELGWKPQIGVIEGFRRTVESFEEEEMRKILVTGGSGFIGRNLVENLKEHYEVCAPSSHELNLKNTEQTEEYLKEQSFDTIIHCANTNSSRVDRGGVNQFDVLSMNLRMYWNLARCNTFYNKMYYFGSGAEFDAQHYIAGMSEDYFGEYIPQDAYGFSKYIMNQDARKSDNIYNLRLFGVYGKYEEWNRRFISNNMCRILCGLNISIEQDMLFDYLYIDDLCQIVIWFIEHTPKFHDYNVCTGNAVRLSEIADTIQSKCKSELPIVLSKKGEKLPYTADNTRLLSEIGEFGFTNLLMGIERLWEYYKREYCINYDFRKQVDNFAFSM